MLQQENYKIGDVFSSTHTITAVTTDAAAKTVTLTLNGALHLRVFPQ